VLIFYYWNNKISTPSIKNIEIWEIWRQGNLGTGGKPAKSGDTILILKLKEPRGEIGEIRGTWA